MTSSLVIAKPICKGRSETQMDAGGLVGIEALIFVLVWLSGLLPTPLNATLCHRGASIKRACLLSYLFLSSKFSPVLLEDMLTERPYRIRLVNVGWSVVSADR